jgi:hypothetical protein
MNWRELAIEILNHPVNLGDEVVVKDLKCDIHDGKEYLFDLHLGLDSDGQMVLEAH